MLNFYDAAGVLGAVLVIIAYFATQQRWLSSEDWRFPAANLIAAVLVLISLYANWNLASFVIEVFWLLISAYGLAKSVRV
jgi:hypothetical protein